jgi:hypothetical protein
LPAPMFPAQKYPWLSVSRRTVDNMPHRPRRRQLQQQRRLAAGPRRDALPLATCCLAHMLRHARQMNRLSTPTERMSA